MKIFDTKRRRKTQNVYDLVNSLKEALRDDRITGEEAKEVMELLRIYLLDHLAKEWVDHIVKAISSIVIAKDRVK